MVGRPFASIVSSSRTGRPCSGPRTVPAARSASSAFASATAPLFSERTAWRAGPSALVIAMRVRYAFVSVSRRERARRRGGHAARKRTPSPARTAGSSSPPASCERRLVVRVAGATRGERRGRHRVGAAVHARVDLRSGLAQLRALLDHVRDADQVPLLVRVRVDGDVQRAPLGVVVAHRDRQLRVAGAGAVGDAAEDRDEVVARVGGRVVGHHPVDPGVAQPLADEHVVAVLRPKPASRA